MTTTLVVCLSVCLLVLVALLSKNEIKATLKLWKVLSFSLDARGVARWPRRTPSAAPPDVPSRGATPGQPRGSRP